jgi:segregation and condensation protein B
MSLKAKLEAVIYAAEEPVTLAQLTALFAADAIEWKAEQAAASAELAAEAAEPLSLLNEGSAYLELDLVADAAPESVIAPAEPAAEPVAEEAPASGPEASPEPGLEAASEPGSSPVEDDNPTAEGEAAEPNPEAISALAEETPADSELEAKRLARLRDREARAIIRQLLDELIAAYASDSRGVEIREIAGGYRMATKPECHDAVRLFVKSLKPALKLSLPALETLAVIAYKQPVTAPEVNEIRGVDSSGVFGSLLARKLIATAGRKQVIGRPILYKTTREFLLRFGLKDVTELPSMEEFEKMAAIELDEPESESEGEPGSGSSQDSGPEFDENASEASTEDIDTGAVPGSAETPAVQEKPVAELPAPMPVVMTAQNSAETPAVTAADPSAATEAPIEAEAPEAESEPQPRSADEPAETVEPNANELANQAESTPA